MNKKTKKVTITKEIPASFQMYKTSEMAELMRTMLAENQIVKQQIEQNKPIGNFNEAYLKIHTALLTDSKAKDETFNTYATHFIAMQKEVFQVAKQARAKQFNEMVNACVACHQNRCTGPIPRIEKLRIK